MVIYKIIFIPSSQDSDLRALSSSKRMHIILKFVLHVQFDKLSEREKKGEIIEPSDRIVVATRITEERSLGSQPFSRCGNGRTFALSTLLQFTRFRFGNPRYPNAATQVRRHIVRPDNTRGFRSPRVFRGMKSCLLPCYPFRTLFNHSWISCGS